MAGSITKGPLTESSLAGTGAATTLTTPVGAGVLKGACAAPAATGATKPALDNASPIAAAVANGQSPLGATATLSSTAAEPLFAKPSTTTTTTTAGTTVVSPESFYFSFGAAQGDAAFIASLPTAVQKPVTMLTESGAKWLNKDAAGATVISYSFLTKAPSEYGASFAGTFSAFNAAAKSAAYAALGAWSEVANIKLTETSAQGGAAGQLRFGNSTKEAAAGWAYLPGAGMGGDVWMNPIYTNSFTLGSYGAQTMLHEIGHALGLAHAGYYNGGNAPATQTHAYDTRQYSVMSYYNDPDYGGALYSARPLLNDMAALQSMYGVNTSTRATDSVYQWADGARFIDAVWDAGGNDTVDASNQSYRVAIDLHGGAFSSIGFKPSGAGAVDNFAIAYNAVIENAKGGLGNDTLVGNDVANLLAGNAGDDTLTGAGGNDVLQGGGGNDTYVFKAGWGADTLTDGSGVNRIDLTAFDRSQLSFQQQGSALVVGYGAADRVTIADFFADMSRYTLVDANGAFVPRMTATDTAPVVAAEPAGVVAGGTVVALSSLFKVSDADGDAIVQFKLRDTGTGAESGVLLKDGVAQPAGQWITIDGSSLDGWSFATPRYGAVDTLELQAFDGLLWSSVTQAGIASVDATDDGFDRARALGTLALGQSVSISDSVAGGSDPADFFAFTVGAATTTGTVEVALRGLSADADLRLYDANRREVEAPWVSPAGEALLTSNLRAGTYYLSVKPHSGTESTAYSLSVTQTAGFNNAAPALTSLDTGAIEAVKGVAISLAGAMKGSDADGTVLKYRVRLLDTTPESATLLWRNTATMATGIWYEADRLSDYSLKAGLADRLDTIEVQAYDGKEWSAVATRQVHSNPTAVDPSLGTAVDLGTLGKTLSVGGDVALADRKADWFKFTVTQTADLSLRLSGLGADADLILSSAQLGVVAGTMAGTAGESMAFSQLQPGTYYLQVVGWGQRTPYTVTGFSYALDAAPVVQSNGEAIAAGGTAVSVASLFKVTDADGDAITQYRVRDLTEGGGTLLLDGVAQPAGGWIDANSLSRFTFATPEAGSTDTIEVQAFDGLKWSNIAAATASTTAAVDDTAAQARDLGTLTVGTPVSMAGSLTGAADPADFYKFVVSAATTTSTVRLDLKGLGADADLTLYDADNQVVAVSAVAGSGDESVTLNLRAGTYYAAVTPHSGTEATAYTLSVAATAAFNNALPTIATVDPAVVDAAAGEAVNLARLFKAADGDGDRITRYRVRETTAAAGSGSLRLAGGATPAVGQWAEVANLTDASFLAGTVAGTDTIEVQAFDGKEWSAVAAKAVRSNPDQTDPGWGAAVDLGTLRTANLSVSGDVAKTDGKPDWYKFTVETPTQLTYALTGLTADADLFFYNAELGNPGSATAGVTAEGGSLSLAAGTYYAQVVGWGNRTNYTVTARAPGLNTAPVVSKANVSVYLTGGLSCTLANLATVTDADGDRVQEIRVRDVSGIAGSKLTSGVTAIAPGTWATTTNLNTISYTAPVTGGDLKLEIQAFDGQDWGTVTPLTFIGADTSDAYYFNARALGPLTLGTPVTASDTVTGIVDSTDAWSFVTSGGVYDRAAVSLNLHQQGYASLEVRQATTGTLIARTSTSNTDIATTITLAGGTAYAVSVLSGQGGGVQAYDLSITETALMPNSKATVMAINSTIDMWRGETVAIGTLFKGSDADGDTISRYRVRTLSQSVGTSATSPIQAGVWAELSPSADLTAVAAAGTSDTLEVQAFDGKEWGTSTVLGLRVNGGADPRLAGALDLGHLGATALVSQGDVALADGRADWFKFTLDTAATVTGKLPGAGSAAELTLFDGTRNIAASLKGATAGVPYSNWSLAAGTYYAQVTGWGDRTPYELDIYSRDLNKAPALSVSPVTAAAGRRIMLKDVFQAADPEGDAITYTIRGNGKFSDGTSSQWNYVTLTQAQAANWYWEAGNDPASDTWSVTASDGYDHIVSKAVTVTTAPGNDDSARFGRVLGNLITGTGVLTATGAIDGIGDRDWFKFTVTQDQVVDIRLSGLSANADLRLASGYYFSVLNESRNGGVADETLTVRLAQGTYAIGVLGRDPTAYSLVISNSASTATTPAPSQFFANDTQTGDIWAGEQRTLHNFFAEGGHVGYRYRDLNQAAGSGSVLGLMSSDGWVYLGNWQDPVFTAGTVDGVVDRIEVQTKTDTGWCPSTYVDIQTHVSDPSPRLSATALGPLGHANKASGHVASGQSQWYSFSLDQPENIYYTTTFQDADVNLFLYDASGKQFPTSLITQGSAPDRGYTKLYSGTYFLEVKGFDPSDYDLCVGINHAPTISVTNATAAPGATVSLADLLSLSDPDGDALSSILFTDSYDGGGYLTYRGNRVAQSAGYSLTGPQLSDFVWVCGQDEGTEYLEVTVCDEHSLAAKSAIGFTTSAAWSDQTGLGTDATADNSLTSGSQLLNGGLLAAA